MTQARKICFGAEFIDFLLNYEWQGREETFKIPDAVFSILGKELSVGMDKEGTKARNQFLKRYGDEIVEKLVKFCLDRHAVSLCGKGWTMSELWEVRETMCLLMRLQVEQETELNSSGLVIEMLVAPGEDLRYQLGLLR